MQIGLVGLGRMGGNMAQRLLRDGHDVVGFDLDPGALSELESHGGTGKTSLGALVEMLEKPRTVWIMVPAGAITQSTVDELSKHMSAGDTLIDGGNSNYKESTRRAEQMARTRHRHVGQRYERRSVGPRKRILPYDRRQSRGLRS